MRRFGVLLALGLCSAPTTSEAQTPLRTWCFSIAGEACYSLTEFEYLPAIIEGSGQTTRKFVGYWWGSAFDDAQYIEQGFGMALHWENGATGNGFGNVALPNYLNTIMDDVQPAVFGINGTFGAFDLEHVYTPDDITAVRYQIVDHDNVRHEAVRCGGSANPCSAYIYEGEVPAPLGSAQVNPDDFPIATPAPEVSVPEPSMWLLLLTGLGGMMLTHRRRIVS